MRRGRTLIFVFLIIIIGLVVAFVAFRQFFTPTQTAEQPQFVEVYITLQPVAQGGEITEAVLTTMKIPPENEIGVMYKTDEVGSLVGKIAKFPLDQGVVITESMVSDASAAVSISGPQWASLIPPGMTAMSVPTNRLAVSAYAINDGAHVNINACLMFVDVDPTYQTILPNLTAVLTGTGFGEVSGSEGTGYSAVGLPILSLGVVTTGSAQGRLELDPSLQQPYYLIPSEAQRPRLVCQTLLQDVVVMKLGNFSFGQTATVETQPTDPQAQQQAPTPPDIITLIVSPQDSITLTYLMYTNAQISMTLRNPSDQARQATEASTLQFLLSQYNIPVPAKLPYAMQPGLTTLTSPFLPNDIVTVPAQ